MNLKELDEFLNSYTTLELQGREEYYLSNSEDGIIPPLPPDIKYCSDELYQQKMVYDYQMSDRKRTIIVHRHERYSKNDYHNHNYIEFMYQYSGHTINSVEGNTMLLNPGDICILVPGVFHIPEIYDDSILINLLIAPGTFNCVFEAIGTQDNPLCNFAREMYYERSFPKYYLQYCCDEKVRQFLNELMLEYFNSGPYSTILSENLLAAALCHMLRSAPDTVYVSPQRTSRVQPVLPILQYIHTNFQTVTLQELVEKFNYSPQHLCRMIKAHTGHTFNEHLQELRINRACQLLISTDFSISRIALISGYNCVSYFHRCFKRALKLSPQSYRESMHSKLQKDELPLSIT